MSEQPKGFKIWFMALRPKTLTAAFAPMLMATAMAWSNEQAQMWVALVCLVTALLLQIGTNIANDYYDFIKGADSADRIGPTRVTQAGLLTPETVKKAFIVCFVLAGVGWSVLTLHAGWVMALLGILSIWSGIYYTAGRKALGYVGLGDLFVFIFFGPVAVTASYYALTLTTTPVVWLAGIGPGLLSVAILTVNNLRDIDSDARVGKRTLAVRLGRNFARAEYSLAILGAALLPLLIVATLPAPTWIMLATLACVAAIPMLRVVNTQVQGEALNRCLAQTGALLLVYSMLFSLGWWLG